MIRLSIFVSAILAAAALLFGGAAFAGDAGSPLILAMAAAVPASGGRSPLSWNRKRDYLKTFSNVPSGVPTTVSTVYSIIPRVARTLFGVELELGGTMLTKALISRVELFLGEVSIWGPVSGTELDNIDEYIEGWNRRSRSANFLSVDFIYKNIIEQGGNQIGGIDLNSLSPGDIRLEVDLAVGVSAPTIRGECIWGPLQGGKLFGGNMMRKLIKRNYAQAPAGDFEPDIALRGCLIARSFMFSNVATAAVVAAQSSAGVANTGDGAMGAITVTARTPTGRYIARCIEPAANLGRFALFAPWGELLGTFNVGTAFSIAGLAGTLADGATDFVAGDGFTIDVLPVNTNQNINDLQVFKKEELLFRRSDKHMRFEAGRWERLPLSQLYVADFIVDNRIDGVMDTLDAPLDYKMNLTAADTVFIIHDVLAEPLAFARSAG